jgi:hypothetical protein
LIQLGVTNGSNQSSSTGTEVQRPSRSLESILDGLTALDPLAASFGASPPSQRSASTVSLGPLDSGGGSDSYSELYTKDLVSRMPSASTSSSSPYTSTRSENDFFDKPGGSQEPSSNSRRTHHSQTNSPNNARQKAQDELFANFPVLPYPPPFLLQMLSSNRDYNDNESKDDQSSHKDSAYQISSGRGSGQYGSVTENLHDHDYYNNTYSPNLPNSYKKQHNNENYDDDLSSSVKQDESTTPFYPSHGIASPPHEVRLPIFPYRNYGASTTNNPTTTRLPYYFNNPQSDRSRQAEEVNNHVPRHYDREGIDIPPGLQFRGLHNMKSHSSTGLNSNRHADHYGDYYEPARNQLRYGQRPVTAPSRHGFGEGTIGQSYGLAQNPPPSLSTGVGDYRLNNNYTPNHHGYSSQLSYEGDHSSVGSTGGLQQHLGGYPLTSSYPVSGGSNSAIVHGLGYGHSQSSGYANDYKTHETVVNAAALQALQSIRGLDRDASYSFTGLGSPTSLGSSYGSLGSSLSGLYR